MILFCNLLLSHLVGDYWFQTDRLCKQKIEKKHQSPFLYIHAVVMGLLAYLLSNVLAGSMLSLGIALICGMGLLFIWSA